MKEAMKTAVTLRQRIHEHKSVIHLKSLLPQTGVTNEPDKDHAKSMNPSSKRKEGKENGKEKKERKGKKGNGDSDGCSFGDEHELTGMMKKDMKVMAGVDDLEKEEEKEEVKSSLDFSHLTVYEDDDNTDLETMENEEADALTTDDDEDDKEDGNDNDEDEMGR